MTNKKKTGFLSCLELIIIDTLRAEALGFTLPPKNKKPRLPHHRRPRLLISAIQIPIYRKSTYERIYMYTNLKLM